MILFVDNEAARAALTKGVSRSKAALLLVYSLRAIPAQYDIAVWTEGVPTQVNPADAPSREEQLSFDTELERDMAAPE